MKILLASTPATGHLNPLLAIGRILIAEGHGVACLSGSAMRDRIEGIGADFHPLPTGADFDLTEPISVVPELKTMLPGPELLRIVGERIFVEPIPAQHRGLQQVLSRFSADVIIADNMMFGVLPMLLGLAPNVRRSFFAVHRSCIGTARTARRISPGCRPQRPWSSAGSMRPSPGNTTG